MLGRYEEAKRIYNQIINFDCSSTLACSLWLMIINLQINEAIDKIDEVSIKYKENSQIFKDLGCDAEISPQSVLVLAHRGLRELGSIASQVNTFGVPNVIGLFLIPVAGIWLLGSGN